MIVSRSDGRRPCPDSLKPLLKQLEAASAGGPRRLFQAPPDFTDILGPNLYPATDPQHQAYEAAREKAAAEATELFARHLAKPRHKNREMLDRWLEFAPELMDVLARGWMPFARSLEAYRKLLHDQAERMLEAADRDEIMRIGAEELKKALLQRCVHWEAEARKAHIASRSNPDADTVRASARPTPAKWAEVKITFLSEERVQVRIGADYTETLNYAEFGFADQRSGKPCRAWRFLISVAGKGGEVPTTAEVLKKIERPFMEVRQKLRRHFHLADDPVPFIHGKSRSDFTGYRAVVGLGLSESFDS